MTLEDSSAGSDDDADERILKFLSRQHPTRSEIGYITSVASGSVLGSFSVPEMKNYKVGCTRSRLERCSSFQPCRWISRTIMMKSSRTSPTTVLTLVENRLFLQLLL